MQVKKYKLLVASATRTLELAVDDMMERGYEPVGGPHGSLGQGFMQAMVGYEEVEGDEASMEETE